MKEEKQKSFLTASDVSTCLDVSVSKAYKIIRQLNDELKMQGYLTVSGRVSTAYFTKKTHTEMEGTEHAGI
jgi:ribosomal protein S25